MVKPYLGKPISKDALKRLQRDSDPCCAQAWTARGWMPIIRSRQIKNHVAQIMVYEGRVGKISVVYWPFNHPSKKWYSEKFITNNIHFKPGDPISQKKLMAGSWKFYQPSAAPQFLEANLDKSNKAGRFKPDGTANTDITTCWWGRPVSVAAVHQVTTTTE